MSTFWTCLRLSCGAINDRQSCSVCGGECLPGEWVPVAERDRYRKALVAIYLDAPVAVARICDEFLDTSAALLGQVRREAQMLAAERRKGPS
jgi:hypothetical protein